MEEYIYYNNLYDCYYELLTDKQRSYFEDYYFKNLSLSEISDSYNVSRNAIYKQINLTKEKLDEYESKLKLFEKKQKLEKISTKINDKKISNELKDLL